MKGRRLVAVPQSFRDLRYDPQFVNKNFRIPARPSLRHAIADWWRESLAARGRFPTVRLFLRELWDFVRESTPEQKRRRYGDVEYDWEHGVDTTSATVSWRDRLLGVFHSAYQPTDPVFFDEMLSAVPADATGFTFIDLGSGKGRTLMMASEYPFRRILGVELLPELNRVAGENLQKYKRDKQQCASMESICADARDFQFPDEPLLIYLFHPLPEPGLRKVLENLEASLRRKGRPVFILYHNPLLDHVLLASPAFRKIRGTHQYSLFAAV
jgi:Methyltransferase domain